MLFIRIFQECRQKFEFNFRSEKQLTFTVVCRLMKGGGLSTQKIRITELPTYVGFLLYVVFVIKFETQLYININSVVEF